jgi:hypothetical protein
MMADAIYVGVASVVRDLKKSELEDWGIRSRFLFGPDSKIPNLAPKPIKADGHP